MLTPKTCKYVAPSVPHVTFQSDIMSSTLFEKLDVKQDDVATVLRQNWDLILGSELKSSQNRTYRATNDAGAQFAVRVAPARQYKRICDELALVHDLFTIERLDGLCVPVFPNVLTWAVGDLMNYFEFRWLGDLDLIRLWGAWMARFHRGARAVAQRHPELVKRMRRYDALHERLMEGVELHPDDVAVACQAEHFGILHGDLNLSNFHVTRDPQGRAVALSVFDFDQIQLGWWEYDLAQAIIGVAMLAGMGPGVPQADTAAFTNTLLEGYEGVAGPGTVDRARLDRMLLLRKQFYARFCMRAQREAIPPEMKAFIESVVGWATRTHVTWQPMCQEHRMLMGLLYDAFDPVLVAGRHHSRTVCRELNASDPDAPEFGGLIHRLLGSHGANPYITPPFRCDYGKNIHVGDNFYCNFNCVFLDVAPIHIGNRVMLAPNVQLYTATHPVATHLRISGAEFGKPIRIGDNCWLGGGVVVCPGITIEDVLSVDGYRNVSSVLLVFVIRGVVTKDLPSDVVAAGNPCRVIRPLTEDERRTDICPTAQLTAAVDIPLPPQTE
ncbi:putative sugar O-acetyltransferase [Paratrimastix pyriformis]|uniref:Sugar O-acetyltransferase n=1 Tax=Paratrimastix pyriformis TaxID=342808 RepID=A0ABQ8URL5_9EUKA|nr:putative sugar O-acetyltransferase [Paratrimastix pyriformis]